MNLELIIKETPEKLQEFFKLTGSSVTSCEANLEGLSQMFHVEEIDKDDEDYLTAIAAAFLGEYLKEVSEADWSIKEGRIVMLQKVTDGTYREVDVYSLASAVLRKDYTLAEAIKNL